MSQSKKTQNSRDLLVTLAQFLDAQEIAYLVDGGALLGIVREGDLISYDTDIDIAVFDQDVERFLASRQRLAELGVDLHCRIYRGKPYLLTIGWRHRRSKALHAHVFTRSPGGFFWSPQIVKHLRRPGMVGAILAGRQHARRTADTSDPGLPHLRDWSGKVWSRAGIPGFYLYRLARFTLRAMGRVDRQSWVDSFPGHALYTCFTWIVPARFFEAVEKVQWRGETLRVPALADGYLAHKYGDDWHTKKPDWVYFLDDHSIFLGSPEVLLPRLERAPAGPN